MVTVDLVYQKIKESDTISISFLDGGGFDEKAWEWEIKGKEIDTTSYGEVFERPKKMWLLGRCELPKGYEGSSISADIFFKKEGKVQVSFEAIVRPKYRKTWLYFKSNSALYVEGEAT